VVVLSLICFGFFPELGGPNLLCFYTILGPQKKFHMSHRHQDIPIRPRYGYVDEESGQAEGAAGRPGSGATPASSYTEIPFLAQYPGAVPEHVLQDLTPTVSTTETTRYEIKRHHTLGHRHRYIFADTRAKRTASWCVLLVL